MIKPTAWRASEPRLLNSALFHGGIFHQMQMISLHGGGSRASLPLKAPLRLPAQDPEGPPGPVTCQPDTGDTPRPPPSEKLHRRGQGRWGRPSP